MKTGHGFVLIAVLKWGVHQSHDQKVLYKTFKWFWFSLCSMGVASYFCIFFMLEQNMLCGII